MATKMRVRVDVMVELADDFDVVPPELTEEHFLDKVLGAFGVVDTERAELLRPASVSIEIVRTTDDAPTQISAERPRFVRMWWRKQGRAHLVPVDGRVQTVCGRDACTPAWSEAPDSALLCVMCQPDDAVDTAEPHPGAATENAS